MDAPRGNTNEEPTGSPAQRSPVRILLQLLGGSLLALVPTAIIALYVSHRVGSPYLNELGNVSFVMMFVVVFVGAAQVFNPQGRTHRFANMPRGSTFFPLGTAKRDVTGQELGGGISPGTVCLVAALELLLISLRFSHT